MVGGQLVEIGTLRRYKMLGKEEVVDNSLLRFYGWLFIISMDIYYFIAQILGHFISPRFQIRNQGLLNRILVIAQDLKYFSFCVLIDTRFYIKNSFKEN